MNNPSKAGMWATIILLVFLAFAILSECSYGAEIGESYALSSEPIYGVGYKTGGSTYDKKVGYLTTYCFKSTDTTWIFVLVNSNGGVTEIDLSWQHVNKVCKKFNKK